MLIYTSTINLIYDLSYMYAAAKEGHLPPFLSCINEGTGSPRPSLFAQVFVIVITELF